MIKAVIFDLDGTLLPINEEKFIDEYLKLLCNHLLPHNYKPEAVKNAIWKGTKLMMKNNGETTNQEVFWESFAQDFGKEKLKDKPIIDNFHETVFVKSLKFCDKNPLARLLINQIKALNLKLILATNPLYPLSAMQKRLEFIGLDSKDFDYITSYENSHFCKGNPKYFEEILQKNHLKPQDVVMFGNNELQDGECAKAAGITALMVVGQIVKNPTSHFRHIAFNEIINHIKTLL